MFSGVPFLKIEAALVTNEILIWYLFSTGFMSNSSIKRLFQIKWQHWCSEIEEDFDGDCLEVPWDRILSRCRNGDYHTYYPVFKFYDIQYEKRTWRAKLHSMPKVVGTPLFFFTYNFYFLAFYFLLNPHPPLRQCCFQKELYRTTPDTSWMLPQGAMHWHSDP